MAASFFFYDLETSGFDPRKARIMQFAGQRTDLDLKPIGEPVNVMIKMTPDILPEPEAILVTGITPQMTITEGLTEAEFLKLFNKEIVKPETIFVGFNSIRFDDEFIRFLNYRNFYDAYEWQWKDQTSRWDILDVVRMTRALKPDGIKWPFAPDGKPTNRLEYLSSINKLNHEAAHDALSDVMATIDVARLVKTKQPQLFDFLLSIRKKEKVREIVDSGKPFMYTAGKYSSAYLHTTAAVLLGRHAEQDYALVYDLRVDPGPFLKMTVDQIIEAWQYTKDPDAIRLPVKTLKYNRCPAILPGVVKDQETLKRIDLDLEAVGNNLSSIKKNGKEFVNKLFKAVKIMDDKRAKEQVSLVDNELTVDSRLYDGFVDGSDKSTMMSVRIADPDELTDKNKFKDSRLNSLLPLYKARNYPKTLNNEEQFKWEAFCRLQLFDGGQNSKAAKYFEKLEELSQKKLTPKQKYLVEELQLYGQSIIPENVIG